MCSDAYVDSYLGAPVDGEARRGDGPRVVRGGAATLSPWQGVGEWVLLLNAWRDSSENWKLLASYRPVLGIRVQTPTLR